MLFQRLRSETGDLHREIEKAIPVFRSDFTLDAYKQLLQRYLAFYSPVEAQLNLLRHQGLSVFDEARQKCPLLEQDLRNLNAPTPMVHCQMVPQLESISQGVGCLYVLEGSTLGGKIIARHLENVWGIGAESGGAFFQSYGENLGKRWKEFREHVESMPKVRQEEDEVVRAARETFRCFNDWLSTRPVV